MNAEQAKAGLLKEYPGIERAIEDVHQHAIATGCEKAIVVERGTGRWVDVRKGDAHSVDFIPYSTFRNCFIVHSHPNVLAELSPQDYLSTAWMRADGILAVCRDNTWSWSHGLLEETVDEANLLFMLGGDPTLLLQKNRFGRFKTATCSDPRFTVIAHDSNRAMLQRAQSKDYFLLPGAELLEVLREFGE